MRESYRINCAILSDCSLDSQINSNNMNKNEKNKDMQKRGTASRQGSQCSKATSNDTSFDGRVRVFPEGKVAITPIDPTAVTKSVTPKGGGYTARGRFVMSDDGQSEFMPYHEKTISRSRLLLSTAHGNIRQNFTGTTIIFRFGEEVSLGQIAEAMRVESEEVQAFLITQ